MQGGKTVSLRQKIGAFLRRETVLAVAWALAVVSALAVPPDAGYAAYVDFDTLMLLFSLMAVMAGLQGLGVFRRLGERLLAGTGTTRRLEAILIFLPYFVSMAVTNDAALITFVPFAVSVLRLAGQERRLIPVVVMQTIAANLGSMATPVGNPQNLYLYARYEMKPAAFFAAVLPYAAACAVLLAAFVLLRKSEPLAAPAAPAREEEKGTRQTRRLGLYLALFALCLAAVAGPVPVWLVFVLVLAAFLAVDRASLARVDYALLATFVGFFIFVGNLGRLELFARLLRSLLAGREMIGAVLASQVLSNVPAALLLSGFTENGQALLIGTNLGGLGTLIASMASLISYKQIARSAPESRGRYLLWFTAANVLFLAALLGLYAGIG